MTGWIDKGLHTWGKQRQGGEEGEKKKIGREIPIESYYHMHFLERGMNMYQGLKDNP